jgi:hypothetical protein
LGVLRIGRSAVGPGGFVAVAAASLEGGLVSGAEIAHEFIDPLTTRFVEAVPYVIGFLVLVSATVFVIAFVRSRGTMGAWERDHRSELDEYDRGERDSVG